MKHRNKLLSLWLCVCLLFSSVTGLSFSAFAEDASSDFSFFYDVIDGKQKWIAVTGLDGPVAGGVLEIPSKINGYTVNEIGWNAFRDRPGLKELILPDTVAYIGGSAFENCVNLKTVRLPAGLDAIDEHAFARCGALEEAPLPEGLHWLGNGSFEDCRSLKTVKLPAGVEFIPDSAFAWCEALEEVELPDNLRELGNSAFEGCSSLRELTVPGSVGYVSDYAFAWCASLEKLTLSEGIEGIGVSAFTGAESLKQVELPSTLHGISDEAFADGALETLHIPAGVEYLSPDAFICCEALTTVTADPGNPFFTAEDNVLYNKDKGVLFLYPAGRPDTSFTLPDPTNRIEGRFAFDGSPLTELNLNHVDSIAPGALAASDISKLTKAPDNKAFVIIDNVLYNDSGEFLLDYPGGLTAKTFTVPEKVWNIEANAFRYNRDLKKVVLPEGLEQIMEDAFAYSSVEEVVIPASVRLLDTGIFMGCEKLKKANLPEGIAEVPSQMFRGCKSLEKVTLPESLTAIGNDAFPQCAFQSIHLPKGLKQIGEGAFYACRSLNNVTLPAGVEQIGNDAFYACRALDKLTVPATVARIGRDAFEETPWFDALPEGPVYIGSVLYRYKGEIPENTSLTVKDGTTMISGGAFARQWGLSGLTVPDSVCWMGNQAVEGTRWFDQILPEGEIYIGKAFYCYKGEPHQKALTLKEGTVSVTPGAFWNLGEVETLRIPASLAELREWDRYDLHGLKEYVVTEGNETFSAADGVLFSGDGAVLLSYPPQKEAKAYEIPYRVETVAVRAFHDNEHLETLTVHATLRRCDGAMEYCPSLKDVYYGGVRRTWDWTPGSYSLLQRDTQLHFTHEDVFKHTGSAIITAAGAFVGDVIFTISDGAGLPVSSPDGARVTPEDEVCSGMIVTMPVDGKESAKEPIVVLGDVDGDRKITSADARLALRYSVKLDNPDRWQLIASRVTGGEKTTSEDARLILRASVGLEDPYDWYLGYVVK